MLTAAHNPFRVECIHALPYQLADTTWEALLAKLAALGYRAAITGPHGHGKSTCLRALGSLLESRGFRVRAIFLNEEHPRFAPAVLQTFRRELTGNDILLFDGSEQLGFWAWWRFLRAVQNAKGLIITTHRPGRLPTLYTCRTSPVLLADLLRQLHADDLLPDGVSPESLFDQHRGNLRDVFFCLYDHLATAPPPQTIRPATFSAPRTTHSRG